MNIDTVQLSHILETGDLQILPIFLSRTVFVISHKNEKVKTLREVLRYLPSIALSLSCQTARRAKERISRMS